MSPTILHRDQTMANELFAKDASAKRREFGRIYPPNLDWLQKQVTEPILEPDLPIVDTHYHVIDLPGFRYLADELSADLSSGHRVEASVFVEAQTRYRKDGPEALRPVGETEFVAQMSGPTGTGLKEPPRLGSGIVGFADLTLGAGVEEVLAAHIEAGGGRFKGIRYATALDESPEIVAHNKARRGVMQENGFRAGLRVLGAMGLSFDAWVFFHQLDEVAQIAQAFPELNIVVGHCGGPLGYGPYVGRREEVLATWRTNMAALAKYPNISVKLGGVLMRLATYDYLNVEVPLSSEALAGCLRPHITGCIELFGAERCMFESNFPVEKMVTGYAVLWNAFKRITADATLTEKLSLYSGTAKHIYRLG